jgi:hypothetical protein
MWSFSPAKMTVLAKPSRFTRPELIQALNGWRIVEGHEIDEIVEDWTGSSLKFLAQFYLPCLCLSEGGFGRINSCN